MTQPIYQERPRNDERPTRAKQALFDRLKFVVIGVFFFVYFVWANISDDPLITVSDAISNQWHQRKWLFWLLALELVRQAHYLFSERSQPWHQWWSKRFFGSADRATRKMDPWLKYRIGRTIRWVLWAVLISLVLGKVWKVPAAEAIIDIPGKLGSGLPKYIGIFFYLLFWIGLQFIFIVFFATRGGIDYYFPDDIRTRFSDVWGQDHVLDRVKENIVFLQNPESIEDKGGYVPGGILLWGPPGTGKTLMAEAVAGETGRPFVFCDPSAFQSGMASIKLKMMFRKVRKMALKFGGVVVFFDEADTLGSRSLNVGGADGGGFRDGASNPFSGAHACNAVSYFGPASTQTLFQEANRGADTSVPHDDSIRRNRFMMMGGMGGGGGGTLQQLLTEMSGLRKPRGFFNTKVRRFFGLKPRPAPQYRILWILATNLPSALDKALLRPGRIDRQYRVGYPAKPGRIRTYEGYFKKVKHELTPENLDRLATMTPYATGASMKDLVNESLIYAVRDGRETVTWMDVIRAKHLKELGPSEGVDYVDKERHATALHEACHAFIAYRVRKHLVIDIATIEKGSNYLGMVSSIKPEDLFTEWRSEYEADIMVSIASLVGERMFFEGDSSSGVSSDLWSATMLATYMEKHWGMGATVSTEGHDMGARVERLLKHLADETEKLLKENRSKVLALTHALETYKTLDGTDVAAVLEGTQGPIVDGRPYYLEQSIKMIEEYHCKMVKLQQDYDKQLVPVPKLPELTEGSLILTPENGLGPNGNGRKPTFKQEASAKLGGNYL